MQLLDKVPVVNIKPTLYQYQHYVFKNQCCQNKNLVLKCLNTAIWLTGNDWFPLTAKLAVHELLWAQGQQRRRVCERKQALFNRTVEAERQLSADLHIKKLNGSCAGHGMWNLDLGTPSFELFQKNHPFWNLDNSLKIRYCSGNMSKNLLTKASVLSC